MELDAHAACICRTLMLIVTLDGTVTETHTCTRQPYNAMTEEYYFVCGNTIKRMTTGNGKTVSGENPRKLYYEKNADLIIVFRGKFALDQIEDFLCKNAKRRSPVSAEDEIEAMINRVEAFLAKDTHS